MAGNPLHGVAIVAAYNTRQAKVLEGETDLSIIREAVNKFHPHSHPPDDITVMVLERKLG